MGNPTVNWFILDIEGAEFQVLQTIPWHLVDIEMISVETDMAGLVMLGMKSLSAWSPRDIIMTASHLLNKAIVVNTSPGSCGTETHRLSARIKPN